MHKEPTMSAPNEGIDQNGGDQKEATSTEVSVFLTPTDHDGTNGSLNDTTVTLNDKSLLNDIDSTPSQNHPNQDTETTQSEVIDNQDARDKVNNQTSETEEHSVAKIDVDDTLNQSRELKSLLALSKEAKLDTNLSRKRKVVIAKKKLRSDIRGSTGKVAKIQFPVTAESELDMELSSAETHKMDTQDDESGSTTVSLKSVKRKKSANPESFPENITDEAVKKSRKSFSNEIAVFKPNKDLFCWRCHKDAVNIACETCPRSYHQKCLKQTITDTEHWPCPECVSILKAESTQSRSPAMRGMTLEHLCSLLKFAVSRMMQCQGSEPFIHEVNDSEFPEYKKYIIQPMDLTLLEKNIKENLYGSTQAFEADAKWILHNSIIFNSYQSKLTTVAKGIIKICKQEMSEIENCPSCYLNANTKKNTWFIEVCPKPHLLVWAKLRGFPFWPGKAMSCKDGMVDVRFFGAHDRAWVPEKECFLYSPKDPNLFRVKRADIEQCVEELEKHVENLKKIYIEFNYPKFKTPIDPENEVKQLQIFLPKYKSYFNKNKITKRLSLDKDKTDSKEESKGEKIDNEVKQKADRKDKKKTETSFYDDDTMEGYGTDDESIPEIDTEVRKMLLKSSSGTSSHEADEDDTQVPANIEPDTSGLEEIVLSGSTRKLSDDHKSHQKKSDSEPSSKRPSFDDTSPHPLRSIRRNSETKTESTRMSDKINRVNISEDVEISLGHGSKGPNFDTVSSSNSECSNDFNVEIKKKPVQVNVDNVEFSISPASKLKISDKLIKRLSDGESPEKESSRSSDKIDEAKRNLDKDSSKTIEDGSQETIESDPNSCTEKDSKEQKKDLDKKKERYDLEVDTCSKSSPEIDNATPDVQKGHSLSETDTADKDVSKSELVEEPTSAKNRALVTEDKLDQLMMENMPEGRADNDEDDIVRSNADDNENHTVSLIDENCKQASPGKVQLSPEKATVSNSSDKIEKPKSFIESCRDEPPATNKNISSPVEETVRFDEQDEAMDTIENVDLNIDKTNIINIIHSSLNETRKVPSKDKEPPVEPEKKKTSTRSSKRKKSLDLDESAIETQNKILRLISIETVMNGVNNNQGVHRSVGSDTSILKSTLQAKKITKPQSEQESPSSSARSSLQDDVSPNEVKSEPESEAELGGVRDLAAKKKYLSALNILEKGEADAQKPKANEIRTRSKTEEKRERSRVISKAAMTTEDTPTTVPSESETSTSPKKKTVTPSTSAKSDPGEIFVKSFAKIGVPENTNNNTPTPPTKQRARKSFPHPNYNKLVTVPTTQIAMPRIPATSTPLPTTDSIPRLVSRTPLATSSPISTVAPTVTSVQQPPRAAVPPLQQLEAMRPTNGYLILQPPQQDGVVFLPPNQTISYSTSVPNQMMSVTPCLVSAPTSTQTIRHFTSPTIWHGSTLTEKPAPNLNNSQNYIPQCESIPGAASVNTSTLNSSHTNSRKLVNGVAEPALITSAPDTSNNVITTSPTTSTTTSISDRPSEVPVVSTPETPQPIEPVVIADSGDDDELSILNNLLPENVSRAVSEIVRRPPPKLKPRPPGALSQQFSEGVPSSAGPVTAKINSVAHRLGDYFRGLLIETLEDLGKSNDSEATIASLKLEIESLKHKHSIEISEIEKNVGTMLKDIQQSILDDRDRVIEETRSACETETIKRVEEAKSKQWCANCSKEAQFYCCWNTSYCDYPCQQKHWPAHMSKCTQNVNQPAQITPSATMRPGSQQLILRPANAPPKAGLGRVFSKPLQKVYMNRNMTAPKAMRVQVKNILKRKATSKRHPVVRIMPQVIQLQNTYEPVMTTAGNLLTMMETAPGNYQLVTTNALVRTATTSMSSIRPGLVPITSVAGSNSAQAKIGASKPPFRVVSHTVPVTTVLADDSD